MILVLCVMVIVVFLSTALLSVSSVMIRNAARRNPKEQSLITAKSVSEVLRKEIEGYEYQEADTFDGPEREHELKDRLQAVWSGAQKTSVYKLEAGGLPGDTMLELYREEEEPFLCVKVTSTVGHEKSSVVSRYCVEAEEAVWRWRYDGRGPGGGTLQ